MDEAARAAAMADRALALLRTELADVPGGHLDVRGIAANGLTRFADVWLDHIFTDLAVRDRIGKARDNVNRCAGTVAEVRQGLARRAARVGERLAAIAAERRGLLTQ